MLEEHKQQTIQTVLARLNQFAMQFVPDEHLGEFNEITGELEQIADQVKAYEIDRETITQDVRKYRRELNIWNRELTSLPDDVISLVTAMSDRLKSAIDDGASLRTNLEEIKFLAAAREYPNGEDRRPLDSLASINRRATEALDNHDLGKALRKEIRAFEVMVAEFEEASRRNGNHYSYSSHTLSQRVQRVVDHYTRMAATSVSNAREFKNDILSWLRAMAINAESVSWAGTHQEKNARLRGLVEVIDQACKRVNELRLEDRTYAYDINDWIKSDFPVREYKRRIYELEAEIASLKKTQAAPTEADPDRSEY